MGASYRGSSPSEYEITAAAAATIGHPIIIHGQQNSAIRQEIFSIIQFWCSTDI